MSYFNCPAGKHLGHVSARKVSNTTGFVCESVFLIVEKALSGFVTIANNFDRFRLKQYTSDVGTKCHPVWQMGSIHVCSKSIYGRSFVKRIT